MQNAESTAIKQIIEEAYIRGIFGDLDERTIRSGFHSDFRMFVKRGNDLRSVGIDEWRTRVREMREGDPELWSRPTRCEFALIDIAGAAAVAKLDVYKGKAHFSTDFMLLYKFEEGWRIASKVFTFTT